MLASSKRRRPMTSSIIKGLHALVVACAHRLGDIIVVQWWAPSAKANVLWERNVGQRKAESALQHWSRITCICRSLCTLFRRHWSWTARVNCGLWTSTHSFSSGLCALIRRILSWSESICQVTRVLVCVHCSGYSSCVLRASTKRHRPIADTIPKAYTFQSWSMCTE